MKDKRPSTRVAKTASRLLRSPRSSKPVRQVSASVLANRQPKRTPKRRGR